MRRKLLPLLVLPIVAAAGACSDDESGPGPTPPPEPYVLQTTTPTLALDQDVSVQLNITVTRGTTQIKWPATAVASIFTPSVSRGAGQGNRYVDPDTIHVDAGGVVTWTNTTGARHSIDFRNAPTSVVDIATTGAAPGWTTGDSSRTMPAVVADVVYTYRCNQHQADSGYIFVHSSPRVTYRSDDNSVATVTAGGRVVGVSGGSTTIHAAVSGSEIAIPVTVTARAATDIELSYLDPLNLASRQTEFTIFAFPGDAQSTQLRAVVFAGTDTVFCNRCRNFNARPQRFVTFTSRDPSKVLVRNTADPVLRSDTTGRLLALDTTTAGQGVYVVLQTIDGLKDSVLVHVALRPIDSLEVRLDSFVDPLDPDDLDPYPTTHIRVDSIVKIGVTFRSKVQDPPDPNTGVLPAARFITVLNTDVAGNVTARGGPIRRAVLPVVTWESANPTYATISSAGIVTALRWFAVNSSQVLSCSTTQVVPSVGVIPGTLFPGPRLPGPTDPPAPWPPTAADIAQTQYPIPGCSPGRTVPMPGALCTGFGSATTADPNSICTIWMRALADDQATGRDLQDEIAITIRRP